MEKLMPHAKKIAALLIARKETIGVSESSTGGLISAALLAVPGASAYFMGGAVTYTRKARLAWLRPDESAFKGLTPSTEEFGLFAGKCVREQLGTTWAVTENGVAGPTGSRYGYPPGRTCVTVGGPIERAKIINTGSDDREANMYAFAIAALELLAESLSASSNIQSKT